jgi:filamentous hemagglutinin family protein
MTATVRTAPRRLLLGASMAALASGLAMPADAQLARLRAQAGTTAPVPSTAAPIVPVRPATMTEALARSQALQSRADQIRGYVTSARDAALAATRAQPTDGLSANGLDPIAAVKQAAALNAAGGVDNIARAQALLASVSAANDATGTNTWEGAGAPVQSTSGGRTDVTITQTQSRALLTWNKFDVGTNTTLTFVQQQGGVDQAGWTAVNRVASSIAPSTILGQIKAPGTILVLNRNGVIFGQGSQLNLGSLLASTLEIGNFARNLRQDANRNALFDAITLKERNTEYLQNGLFAGTQPVSTLPSLLLSPLYAAGTYSTTTKPALEGSVVVDPGASITAGSGGFVILAAPKVTNAGSLSASNGQISLQGGRLITAVRSTGAVGSADVNVRGLILRTVGTFETGVELRSSAGTLLETTADDGAVVNSGLIDSPRGYLSLGAGLFGTVTNAGLLSSTTSVSRNGKIEIDAGYITLAGSADPSRASGIVITPDSSTETIPQGTADAPAPFKTSQIQIGARADSFTSTGNGLGVFLPSVVSMGQNSLILAPNANVVVGRDSTSAFDPNLPVATRSAITIAAGAAIDVSGVKDVQLAASRNSIEITPVKRNELRDTPTYREVSLTGDFTLNGTTLFVDPRLTGVRADGVRWVGSPLIEAGSIASQIGVTAAELMTRGGNVSLGVNLVTAATPIGETPRISIAPGATIDFGGGWVHYNAGTVRTSNLLTSDGRIVNIGDADPNDIFVGVADGYTQTQPRFGLSETFNDPLLSGSRVEAAYDEGRDAGVLVIGGSALSVAGSLYGEAFAGSRQIASGARPSGTTTVTQDSRALQRSAQDLPSGGFLRIGSFTGASGVALGGNMAVVRADAGATATDGSTLLLSDAMLSRAGLGALTLQTSGGVQFRQGSALTLADGGTLRVDAGRSIRFDGSVRIASGRIAARTYELSAAPIAAGSISALGSAFDASDDLAGLYTDQAAFDAVFLNADGSAKAGPFDLTVTGTLSTAGRFVNDYRETGLGRIAQGGAFIDGGSISLAVAPKVLVAIGETLNSAQIAGDLSGRLTVASGAALDVSAGAYVAADRTLSLTAAGGDLSLINETTYASTVPTVEPLNETPGRSNAPIAGSNQSVDFTPTDSIVPALVPTVTRAGVSFDQASLKGFGFSGGGTFTLVSPSISFGSDTTAGASHLGLDFFAQTGFGTLNATTFRSRIVRDIFTNERQGNSAFFETTAFQVKSGETLDLTQSLLPQFLTQTQAGQLLTLGTDSAVTSVLTPGVPTAAFDRVAANLTLGGLTELDVLAGGRVIGAAEARITAPKILNEGSIVLPGGSLIQRDVLPVNLAITGLGVDRLGQVFGQPDANGQFDETALNTAGITGADGNLLTIRELFTQPANERFVYFTGRMGQGEGMRLADGSVTDLSGTALVNTRAAFLPNGQRLVTGRLVDGGTISTATFFNPPGIDTGTALFTTPAYGNPRYIDASVNGQPPIVGVTDARTLVAGPGATVDLSGASAMFDEQVSATSFAPRLQWSDGGVLRIGGGGSIAGASIDARGGAPLATGGTLSWVRPTIVQSYGDRSQADVVAADQIEASGFATVNALGGVTFSGTSSLTLAKAFTVSSAPSTAGVAIANDAQVTISAMSGADASVYAPFIRFASRLGTLPTLGDETRNGGSLLFTATSGIDVVGGILFDSSVKSVTLATPADLRLIGVDDRGAGSNALPSLNGQLVSWGDLTIDAGRTYATTGTGNLQRFIEDQRTGTTTTVSPYLLAALGKSSITFDGTYLGSATTAPLSAGSYLKIQAAEITQGGYLAAPFGRLEIGGNAAITLAQGAPEVAATKSVTFTSGSVTTVSGAGLNVPYGTTTDLTEYFFSPSVGLPITVVPVGQVSLAGGTIDVAAGSQIDGRGGGDVFAYEFVSGTGGSRDVLDRFNRDAFSSNDYDPTTGIGYQYPDRRQVYAIVPADQARSIATFDPLYSADYQSNAGSDLYGAQVGLSVTLDGGNGVPAGEYVLLPAHYALLPGAYRVVENIGAGAPAPGSAQTLLDGSVIVGGTFSTAGTDLSQSQRRSFTVQSRDVFGQYSRLETTGGTKTVVAQAQAAGRTAPRIPLDAARVVLAPKAALTVAGAFDTTPAEGGKGAQFDILAKNILIAASDGVTAPPRTLLLSDDTLARLNANSLSIGAERSENADGTTSLGVVAKTITVTANAAVSAPELILAVGGRNSALRVRSGATLTATGTLDDTATGDYVIASLAAEDVPNAYPYDPSGVGAVLRLSSGSERLIQRTGAAAAANAERPTALNIGSATLTGKSVAIDTSGRLTLSDTLTVNASLLALSGDTLRFGAPGFEAPLLQRFAAADRLTLRSRGQIEFARGTYTFNDLRIDAPAIALDRDQTRGDVKISADVLTLGNSAADLGACTDSGVTACGAADSALSILASQVSFIGGTTRTYGFGERVTLGGSQGMYVSGKGTLDTGATALTLATPFLADRAVAADPREQAVRPDYTFATTGAVTLTDEGTNTAAVASGNAAPGARIAFGTADATVASVTVRGTDVRATSGIIDVQSRGGIVLDGGASLATPGYARTFGDSVDSVTVVSGGGTVNLQSLRGSIAIGAGSGITVDNGSGEAGTINLLASNGAITFGNLLTAFNPGATGTRSASLALDAGTSAFDLGGFANRYASLFGGELAIRSGAGDLSLGAGQTLRAEAVTLVADGGSVLVSGTIDTSGRSVAGLSPTAAAAVRVDGGDVSLYGARGVTLGATALIDTHTSGYLSTDTRSAKAGDVAIGIGDTDAAITFASGARIDAGARRTEAAIAAGNSGVRLVAQTVKDPFTLADTTVYRMVQADQGGTVSFRAPVVSGVQDTVDVRLGGTISGAGEVQIEGFRRYDLDALAASGKYSGITATRKGVSLDFSQGSANGDKRNFLTEVFGSGANASLAQFIQSFDIAAKDGSDLSGIRLRPGVELVSSGTIAFATNWNLAAGTLDERAAVAAGLLTAIPELGIRPGGSAHYAVTPGREGELLQDYVTMLYRVGGKADGEAGVVTVRARGSLDIAHDISDGFFSFGDKTDPKYLSYQFAGGNREVAPAGSVTCGTRASGNDCGSVISFDRATQIGDPTRDQTLVISLDKPGAGTDLSGGVLAPYSAAANSAAGSGSGRRGAGDPLGGADLFPLLDDGTRAVRSTSLRLVAGGDATLSADPLHVDRATGANAVVRGETSYTITVAGGKASFAGSLELKLPAGVQTEDGATSVAPADYLAAAAEALGPRKRAGNKYTVLNWGDNGEIADTTRARARDYFARNFPEAVFQGDGANATGVAAPLSAILGFLQAYGDEYAAKLASGEFSAPAPNTGAPPSPGRADTVNRGTVVRTGDGSIDLVAARTVDLRRTEEVVYRNAISGTGNVPSNFPNPLPTKYQVGGTAVYTAGHLVTRQPIVAVAPDGSRVTYSWTAGGGFPAIDPDAALPSFAPRYFNTPQLVDGGGDVAIRATTGDVLSRRDAWSEQFLSADAIRVTRAGGAQGVSIPAGFVGASDQRWRVGQIGQDSEVAIVPQLFTSGVGALGGGDVSVVAGGRISDLTLALDTSITTANPLVPSGSATNILRGRTANGATAPATLVTFGGGNADVRTGGNVVGGQFDIASGVGSITVGGNLVAGDALSKTDLAANEFRLRVADAYVRATVRGQATVGGIGALGVTTGDNSVQNPGLGFFSAAAGFNLVANEQVTLKASRPELIATNFSDLGFNAQGLVLPPTLELASVTGDLSFSTDLPRLLFPSYQGQLSLIAGGDIASLALSMSDSDPSLLPGAFSVRDAAGGAGGGLNFGFNGVTPTTSDAQLRLFHNERPTHADDDTPARVYAGGSITDTTLSLAKQARIGAGLDIVDMVFTGQNVRDGDVTRITAGRDIIGTTGFASDLQLPFIRGNTFTLGGYGALSIEAGRNLGPFLNSATLDTANGPQNFAGGIRTVGNDLNPWLQSRGADVQAFFGIGKGANYDGLQAVYLNPANAANLDGDLFVQVADANGNLSPDRSRPIYAPVLADWLAINAPGALAAAFGGTAPTGTALESASYAQYDRLYAAFSALDNLTRRTFLVNEVYFNELSQPGIPSSPSYQQYVRGYRATQTLFPPTLGYTDNLASYTTDPATVTANNPLGVPTRTLDANGQPVAATRVLTGNVDLRLATIQTVRGGDVTILGPGGDVLAGSVVRTSDQAARRVSLFGADPLSAIENGYLTRTFLSRITAIPIGFEGVLSLRGGSIRSFTDGDFRLNQSRLFTLAGGDIELWSSNGDLNAGQGPRSASSFPPITVRFDQNGNAEVDSAGSVAGAGIGAFKQTPSDADANIILIAPVGEVDAGDAGVRASGNVFVAAARVANADNFSAGGDIAGVPSSAVAASAAAPTSAASSIVGNVAGLANAAANNADKLSLISVDVLGFFGSDRCDDPNASTKDCPPRR